MRQNWAMVRDSVSDVIIQVSGDLQQRSECEDAEGDLREAVHSCRHLHWGEHSVDEAVVYYLRLVNTHTRP